LLGFGFLVSSFSFGVLCVGEKDKDFHLERFHLGSQPQARWLVGLQSPAACATRAGGDSDPAFENYGPFHAQSPDTGRDVHARSWRANRDVDVRR